MCENYNRGDNCIALRWSQEWNIRLNKQTERLIIQIDNRLVLKIES